MGFCVPPRHGGVVFALVAGLLPLAVSGLGCAHVETAADRHIAEMRETIGKVQVEQDRANQRLDLLEGPAEEAPRPPRASAEPRQPAPLRAVQIGDADDSFVNDDPDDPTSRPEIRVQGTPGISRGARARPSRAREAQGDNDGDREGSRSSFLDPEAKKAYDAALQQVHAKQYDRALDALSAFLAKWPDHPYAENATYWRGECYFARGEYLRAAEQFEAVVVRYGGIGAKAPDALLKMGMCHERLGSSDRSKEYWDRLRREYPRSDAARKIPQSSKNDTQRSGDNPAVGPKESR